MEWNTHTLTHNPTVKLKHHARIILWWNHILFYRVREQAMTLSKYTYQRIHFMWKVLTFQDVRMEDRKKNPRTKLEISQVRQLILVYSSMPKRRHFCTKMWKCGRKKHMKNPIKTTLFGCTTSFMSVIKNLCLSLTQLFRAVPNSRRCKCGKVKQSIKVRINITQFVGSYVEIHAHGAS